MATISPGIYEEVSRALAEAKRIMDSSKVPGVDDDGVPLALVQRISMLLQRLNGLTQEVQLANRCIAIALKHEPVEGDEANGIIDGIVRAEYEVMQAEMTPQEGGSDIPPPPPAE